MTSSLPSPAASSAYLVRDALDVDTTDADNVRLLARLSDGDATLRRLAVLDVAELEDDAWLPLLVERLRTDTDADVRRTAAERLSGWETDEVVESLCDALHDNDEATRAAAADSLSALKQADPGRALVRRLLAEHDTFARAALLRALRELRLPESAAPALGALEDSVATVRREAVAVLGWLRHTDALPALATLVRSDPSPEVRKAAAGALGFAADDSIQHTLIAALNDVEWQVREEAAATLGKLRLVAARDALALALDDEYWQVTLQSARALGRLKLAASTAAISALLTFPISNVRKEAALALGEIGDVTALAVLEAALGDADPEVRKAARIAIAQIGAAPHA
ncbi:MULTISPECIES: HEAT repeat domain-containing protein [Pandoraea]|uniref:HEAT repeat domain-containing protein n=1 Tax=Pandoraea TaxID=93217 RepID=UPI001F5D31A1|nr:MULTISPECIES: HEAT repeat domain-containing protein [Pandoraea]MCI3206755.1 PBS lyase [Pandoraea sp. LA3]MDN4584783.1 PBS lyase [Pandoraea capi]